MSAPFMQLYVADYLGDTQHLTTEQHGAYLLLLMTMWRQGGSLPNDDRMLARIARISARRWHLIRDEVMAFFDVEEGQITQKRLVEEYQKAASKSEKRSASGKLGGEAKALKDKKQAVAKAKQKPQHLSEPEPDIEADASKSPPTPKPELIAFDRYNESARRAGWPIAQALTPPRFKAMTVRLAECGGLEGWDHAMTRAEASSFLTGRKTDFRADLDFFLQAKSFRRLMEGSYDDTPRNGGQHEQSRSHAGKPGSLEYYLENVAARRGSQRTAQADPDGTWQHPGGVRSWDGADDRGAGRDPDPREFRPLLVAGGRF